jgi:membrane associated rhomboid family serine protease
MIAANVLAFVGVTALAQSQPGERSAEIISELMLVYGQGLRPWQWITSNFIHSDILHLLGNMFCLWGFGLVVEGKIGWWRFLLVCLGIGVIQCAAEQTIMLFAEEGASLGASSIVYGLLAIAMIWAPQNEMNCIFLIFIRPIRFDVTVYTLAVVFALIEIGIGVFAGLTMSSQVLHLMGIFLGLAVGIVMLKKGWVDCEGWDLFRVWAGKEGDSRREENDSAAEALLAAVDRKRLGAAESVDRSSLQFSPEQLAADSLQMDDLSGQSDIQEAIAAGDAKIAFAKYQAEVNDPLNEPSEQELLQIIALFQEQKQWSASIPPMVEYLRHFKKRQVPIRLRLARVLLDVKQRPRDALKVLEPLSSASLKEKDAQTLSRLKSKAKSK